MKRIIALIMALIMAITCLSLVSCGSDKPDDGKKQEQQKDKDKEKKDDPGKEGDIKVTLSDEELDVPEDLRYENYKFTVFAPYPSGINYFVRDALNDDPVNDAIYNRNLALQDQLGVEVNCIDFGVYTDKQAQKIIDSVLAGDHSFDAAAIHNTSACAALIIADAVLSFDNLEYCDQTKPWWVHGFSEQCSLLGEDYFGINSACYGFYSGAACILFNKDLAEEYELPDIYELVRNGEWTVDKLIELTKNFSQDLNSDGIYDNNDLVAITSDDFAYMNYWYGAFRQSTVEKGENDEPTYTVGSARMSSIIEKLNTLFNTGRRGIIYPMSDRTGDNKYMNMFAEGRTLFYIGAASSATSLRAYDINFGIVPMPKFDKNQEEYGSWVDPWCLTMCVPIDNEDPERTSAILESMAYHSYHLIYPALIEQKVFGTGTRDIESLEMLEKYIFPNVFFDFGYIYDGWGAGYSDLIRTLVPNNSTDTASFIAEKKNTAESHYSDVYDAVLINSNK